MRLPPAKSDDELRARLANLTPDEIEQLPSLCDAKLQEPRRIREWNAWVKSVESRRGPRGKLANVDLNDRDPSAAFSSPLTAARLPRC